MGNEKIKKISENIHIIPKEGKMNVPDEHKVKFK